MKLEYKSSKILLTFFFIAFFVVILPNVSEAANRYWVGGGSSVNWNATVPTNWGTASNTQDDASVPGAGDDVFFDGVGTGASNSTLSASITVNSLDMTGYANTLTHNTAVTVTIDSQNVNGDSLLMVAGMTYVTGSLTTSAFSFTGIGTNDITTGGKILGNVTFSNTGDTFRLLDGLNTTGNFSLSAGIFDANLQTVTMSGADQTITPTAALTFYNLTRTGTATKLDVLTLAGNITVTNILTLAGNSSTNRLLVESSVLGTTRTITNTGATMTWSNVDFVDIDLSTAYDCSAITGLCGDAGGNTDITFTTADENFWIGDTGNWNDAAEWSTSSGGAANGRVPLPQDDATFDANSFSTTGFTVTSNMPRSGKNIDFSAVGTDNPTWTVPNEGYNNIIYGSLTLDSGMTVAGSNGRVFQGRGAFTLTNAGVTYARAITVQMVGGTLTLLDAYDSASTIIFSNGTFDANDFNVTGSGISISGSATKVVTMGSGTWTATSVSTAWGWSTSGTTLNEETSTIVISNTTATAKTFAGAGETYNNLTITGDDVTITGNNTFNILALNNPTEEEGLIIGTGSTQTVSSITTTASSGNVVLLSGVAGGGAETISDASGTNCLDYLTITNVTVSGGATFHAGSHSTDGGGNSGWLFTDCDTTPPTITNVSSDKANGSYTTGEVIDIDVTFSEEVTSTGNVTVTLETGTTDQTCTFTVTAATTGTCNYTVVSGDTSADLTVSTISGTINDAAGNAMTNFVPTTNLAANKDIVIIVVTAPTLTTSAASSVADTTATLNGDITATGGANATARGFEYGTTISYGTSTTSSGSYGIASFSDNITSLTCATTYHFRSYATNSAGTGSGADATFTTTSCPSSGGGGGGNSGLGGGGGGGTIIVNAPTVVEIIENPIDFIDNQIITPIFTTIDKIIPSFLKPKPVPVKPIVPVEELVTEKVPLALGGIWQLYLLPQKAEFVLAPLPKAINDLAQKFPTLEQTFNEVGISKITDITKLNNIKLNLPGLTERVGLSTLNIKPSIFSLPEGIPIGNLSLATKKQIPAEIIFVKTGAELIDFNPTLSVSDKGEPEQKINTISGKLLQLAVKPDKPVESVKGYVVFKSRAIRSTSLEIPSDSLLASAIFATPVFAQIEEKPVRVEEKLVLLEFLYTDIDGDGIYTAEIKAPLVEGEYEIITVLDFIDPDLGNKQIRLTTVVDPEGYVYSTLPAGKLRIAGAVVSIYWLNPGTKKYEIWSAKEYQQENPQVTDDTGKYSFLVPPGTYYLRIEHPNYPAYQSETFVVKEGSGVHMNIELKTKYWWLQIFDWKTTLLVLVIILLLYNFYRDKMRESLMK